MANASLKKDFIDGEKLFAVSLNNNFATIEAALAAMNKIVWQDDEEDGVSVSAYKGNIEEIEARELIDGQLLYNTETGETYIDTYVNDVLTRINTGSGNVVAIQETEPTNPAVKLWIETDMVDSVGDEFGDRITVLYDGSSTSGTTGDVTLAASAANFDYIEIFFFNDTIMSYNSVTIANPNGKTATLINSWDNETYLYYWSENCSISGETITRGTASRWRFGTSGTPTRTTGDEVTIAIVKVIGYNK